MDQDRNCASGPLFPWARGLTPEHVERVRATLAEREYAAGSIIFRRGEKLSHWCGVLEGLLRVSRDTPRGKTISTYPCLGKGTWFGEDALMRNAPLPYDVIAVRATRLLLVPGATFKWLLTDSLVFNRFIIEQLSLRVQRFIDQLEIDRLRDPEVRIARCIAWMINTLPGATGDGAADHEIEISQEELGRIAGTSRQRVNRAVQRLKKERLLATNYCRIKVVDINRLRAFGA
ncbi:MAG TPA: Crp/Fnr family transcriptional regulator [Burkholderiaceae bacterium]|nr:Crp/Fnr family transcriptional regulator [Burkholderiaceae bacterium]